MTITPIHSEGAGAANNRPGDGSMTDTVEQCDREAAALPEGALHILQHSLGVDQYGQGEQYRNRFVTGEGSIDHPICNALVAAGLMGVRRAMALTGGMDVFWVTDAGKAFVAANSPPAPKLTAGQRRYRAWLDVSDVAGETFIDFCRRSAIRETLARQALESRHTEEQG